MIDYPHHVEFFAEGITIDASFRNREDGVTFMEALEQIFPNGSNNDKEKMMVGSPDPINAGTPGDPLPAPAQTPQPNQPPQAGTNGGVIQPQDAPAPLYDVLKRSVDHANQAIHSIDHALHSIKASGLATTRDAEHAVVSPIESALREAKKTLEAAVQSAKSHL